MLDAFKVKPYDLEPVYVSWNNAPVFQGKANDDPVVWLREIKAGCIERKVPKEQWHRVGRHYLGPKPRERLEQLGKVMQQMSGDKHTWNWKKFKLAMVNLGWTSQAASKDPAKTPPPTERPVPKKQGSWWIMSKPESQDKEQAASEEIVVAKTQVLGSPQITSEPSSPPTADSASLATVSKAPAWLVNACTALDYLTAEHPTVMSAMSAILITVGALPATAVSAGAGGTVMGSAGVKAVSAVAAGVGQWLKAQQDGQLKIEHKHAQ